MAEPTITSKNIGSKPDPNPAKPTAFVKEEALVTYDNVVAKPLQLPNFLNLKHRQPNMSLYWGNRAVGEKESGLRYSQLLSMGFIPCKPEEIVDQNGNVCPESLVKDGRVLFGDLILLKIPKADFLGALKYNAQRAMARVKKFGVVMEGNAAHQASETRDVPRSAFQGLPSKAQPFVPPLSDIDKGVNLADK